MTSSIDISQFFDVFQEESEELLAEMESLLLGFDLAAHAKDECDAIFRTAHSIKGGAATFGLTDMVELTHIMESLLDKVRKGSLALTEDHVSALLKAKDVLKRQLTGHKQKQPLDPQEAQPIMAALRDLSDSPPPAPTPPPPPPSLAESPLPAVMGRGFRIELPKLPEDELSALKAELGLKGPLHSEVTEGGGEVLTLETAESRDEVMAVCGFLVEPEDVGISELGFPGVAATAGAVQTPVNAGLGSGQPALATEASLLPRATLPDTKPLATGAEIGQPAKLAAVKAGGQESKYIRVNLERVDQLINLVGELVITQAMIEQHANSLDAIHHEQLLNHFATLSRNTRDLQESVMSIRMMPMELVFSRFPRMVRELAAKLGKKVKLVTFGGRTELDKGLIERIVDPLTHLVRNSVDHGLELPNVRKANNKPETGTVTLSAAHESGNIVLQVADDGIGLDRGLILHKAKDFGIAVNEETNDAELWQAVFHPGFTTASGVTDISGRGVGMDVVKRNITAMGGSVKIASTPGQGTVVTISLPLTLAILEGMLVKSGEEVYIMPLLAVVESLKPVPDQIHPVSGKGRVIRVREEYIPLILLNELFQTDGGAGEERLGGMVVIVEALGVKAALMVDSLVGQQQIVVKNLETNYRKIPGISGATILGDGSVSLILDVPALLEISRQFGLQRANGDAT